MHQKALLAAVNEATVLMRQARAKFAGIKANKDLHTRRRRRGSVLQLASALSAELDTSPTRARAREACEYVLGRVRGADHQQAAEDTKNADGILASTMRAQLHDLKDAKERMSVLAKHGSDLS